MCAVEQQGLGVTNNGVLTFAVRNVLDSERNVLDRG
jgi:hypothetical protein